MIRAGWILAAGGWRRGAGETNSHSHHPGLSSFGRSSSGSSSSLQPPASSLPRRAGFTLVELLITVSVIAIMATMVLFALFAAQETAKAQKTKSLIAKLDSIIKAKYETYKTRRIPQVVQSEYNDRNGNGSPDAGEFVDTNSNGTCDPGEYTDYNGDGSPNTYSIATLAKMRLDTLRDIMRMEMPDRWTDIDDDPVTPLGPGPKIARPAISRSYQRRKSAGTASDEFQYAECLYMIVMEAQQEEADDRSTFKPDQIADIDGDGFSEFVDAWGRPIRFLRWAPGFISDLQAPLQITSTNASPTSVTATSARLQNAAGTYVGGAIIKEDLPANAGRYLATTMARITDYTFTGPATGTFTVNGFSFSPTNGDSFYVTEPDPFDPRHVYPIVSQPVPSFAIYPLIYSGGPDKCTGVVTDFATPIRYSTSGVNPFQLSSGANIEMVGTQRDLPTEANFVPRGWLDNIHNHMITAR